MRLLAFLPLAASIVLRPDEEAFDRFIAKPLSSNEKGPL